MFPAPSALTIGAANELVRNGKPVFFYANPGPLPPLSPVIRVIRVRIASGRSLENGVLVLPWDDGVTYYTVENEAWGDVDDPDVWNIGYAQFICTADQLVHGNEPER